MCTKRRVCVTTSTLLPSVQAAERTRNRQKQRFPFPQKRVCTPCGNGNQESRHDGAEARRAAGRMAYTNAATTSSRDWGSRSMTGISGIV